MSDSLVSSQTPNHQWKIHGSLLLPNNFQDQPQAGSEEPQSSEESDDDDEEDLADLPPAQVAPPVAPPIPQAPPQQPVTVVAPARPIQSAKPKDEVPQKWWFVLGGILVFGFLAIAVVNRPQVKGESTLPNTSNPQQAAPTSPAPQQKGQAGQPDQPLPSLDLNAYEQARDQKFKEALDKARVAWGSCGQVCRSRRDYYLSKAEEILKTTGTPMEVTLLRELNRQIGEQTKILPYNSELGGFSTEKVDQIGIARSLSGDALALLEALDHEWTRQRQAALGQPLPARTMTTVDLAPLSNDMATLWQLAALARNGKPQQALRDSVTFEPPAAPPKPEPEDKKPAPKEKTGLPK